jgi:hypothetical protein
VSASVAGQNLQLSSVPSGATGGSGAAPGQSLPVCV